MQIASSQAHSVVPMGVGQWLSLSQNRHSASGTLHVISSGLVGWEDILSLNCGFLVTSINHESQVVMHLGSFECCVHGM